MKLYDPTKPYIIEAVYRCYLTPSDGVTEKAWEAFCAAISKMADMRTYNGVAVTFTRGGPASTPYYTIEADSQPCLERFMDRAYTIARNKHVRLIR